MREGPYEIQLIGEDGRLFPEIEFDDGQCIASAEPGKTYHVLVNVYRDIRGLFPAKYLRFGLYVDGVDVQYWKRIDLSNEKLLPSNPALPVSSRFWGFKKNLTEMLAFTFTAPVTNGSRAAGAQTGNTDNLGTIRLVVYEAQVTNGVYDNQSGYGEAPAQRTIGESAKFWQQASVTTTAGRPICLDQEKFSPLPRWSNISKIPLEMLVLRYHTLSMIDFLAEFRHRLVPDGGGVGETRALNGTGSKRGSEVLDLTGDDDDQLLSAAVGSSSNRATEAGTNLGTDVSGNGDTDARDGSGAADPTKRRRVQDGSATGNGDLASDTSDATAELDEREELIDEEISYVVRRKEVTILDLSEDPDS
jgi:hypothetical protein